LRVDVAAGGHGGQRVVGAGAARKEVADGVHAQRAAELPGPGRELLAPLPVELAQSQAAHAAARRGADGRQRHQALPQARAVHVGGKGKGGFGDSVHGSARTASGWWRREVGL
jgi:hypothetical protein